MNETKRTKKKSIYQLKNDYIKTKKKLIDEFVNSTSAFAEAGLNFQDVIDRYNQLRKTQTSKIINN